MVSRTAGYACSVGPSEQRGRIARCSMRSPRQWSCHGSLSGGAATARIRWWIGVPTRPPRRYAPFVSSKHRSLPAKLRAPQRVESGEPGTHYGSGQFALIARQQPFGIPVRDRQPNLRQMCNKARFMAPCPAIRIARVAYVACLDHVFADVHAASPGILTAIDGAVVLELLPAEEAPERQLRLAHDHLE